MNDQRGWIGTYTCRPRPPDVFGKPSIPASARISRSTGATLAACEKSVPGCGSRSIRSWSRLSSSEAPDRPGVEGRGAEVGHQATTASSVGHTSSAGRPLGKVIVAVSTHSGAPFGTRFW